MFTEPQYKNIPQQSTNILPKLEISHKDDEHEKEANEVAGKVMKMGEGEAIHRKMGDEDENKKVHKMHDEDEHKKVNCMHEEDEGKKVYKMHDEDENKKVHKMHDEDENKKVHKMHDEEDKYKVMKKGESGDGMIAPAHVETGIQNTKGGGQNLPGNVQKDLGGKMKADLSDVKIHTDNNAHEMSESINAKAFTHGQYGHLP
jgi:hypothetical protein